MAKALLMQGNKVLSNLMNTDMEFRNTHCLQSDELKKVIQVSLMNSLLIS